MGGRGRDSASTRSRPRSSSRTARTPGPAPPRPPPDPCAVCAADSGRHSPGQASAPDSADSSAPRFVQFPAPIPAPCAGAAVLGDHQAGGTPVAQSAVPDRRPPHHRRMGERVHPFRGRRAAAAPLPPGRRDGPYAPDGRHVRPPGPVHGPLPRHRARPVHGPREETARRAAPPVTRSADGPATPAGGVLGTGFRGTSTAKASPSAIRRGRRRNGHPQFVAWGYRTANSGKLLHIERD